MKIPTLDLAILAKFLLPAIILAGIIIYLLLRSIVVYVWQATHTTKVQKKVEELRTAKPKAGPVIVRKTDLYAQLSSEQKKDYVRAKELAERQQFIEAAKLFESINFQRQAIDLLEKNAYIDEACAILLRMGIPYRAAVLYERNGRYLKASEYFMGEGKQEEAARCFEKLAGQDFTFFRRAGECYLKANLIDNALLAFSRLDTSRELLHIALEHQRFEFLQRYLDQPFHSQVLLPQLTPPQIESLVKAVALTPQSALSLVLWTMYRPDETLIRAVLQKLQNKELAQVFWSRLDEGFCGFICELLPTLAEPPALDVLLLHSEVLLGLGKLTYAERLRKLAGALGEPPPPTLAIGL